jgi:hypothetical protein
MVHFSKVSKCPVKLTLSSIFRACWQTDTLSLRTNPRCGAAHFMELEYLSHSPIHRTVYSTKGA